MLRAAAGSVLYLALIALLSLGAATAVRDSAAAIGVVLALLYLFPIIAAAVADPHGQRHLQQIGPISAGLAIETTTGLRSLPISPWAGSACSPPGPPPRSLPASCCSGCATPEREVQARGSADNRPTCPNSPIWRQPGGSSAGMRFMIMGKRRDKPAWRRRWKFSASKG